MTLSLLAVCQLAAKIAEEDGREWAALTLDVKEQYMALAAEQLRVPKPSTFREVPPWAR